MPTEDQPESEITAPAEANEPGPAETPLVPADPKALIDRLIAAGEWPEPALLEQIIATGESAIGPLLEFMRTYPDPRDYKREIVFYHGIGILGEIRSPGTIPELVEILRRYPGESGAQAAEVLGGFGPEALEPLLELVRDPGLGAKVRRNAIDAAKVAVGADPALRSRLADVLRPILADALERTRAAARAQGEEDGEADADDKGWTVEGLVDDDDLEDEDLEESEEERAAAYEKGPDASAEDDDYEPDEELMFLVCDMADLADAQARDLVDAAFREDLIDTFWVDKGSVDESYRKGGEPPRPLADWLEDYREQYRRHLNPPKLPPIKMEPLYQSSLGTSYPREVAEPIPEPKVEPVRNTGPKLGRNDPCWCGSGKKYKKCHWGKPGP